MFSTEAVAGANLAETSHATPPAATIAASAAAAAC